MNHKKKNFILVLLVLLVFVIAGIVYSCSAGQKAKNAQSSAAVSEETTETESSEEDTSGEMVCVHVCGSVNKPGVYYLEKGARVHEAVEMAGGMTEEADPQYVNLAKEAQDGSQIYIPSMDEVEEGAVPMEAQDAAEAGDGLVNINSASYEELKTLPGIGDIKAEAIIAYRESTGGFSAIEDIMNVAGIKESSFEKIKDHIRV